ncbi:MAG: hypothetical protein OEM15_09160 [Myxococcales bacterium]|nr:hypothetical protein [Myxococcales bacterium]MDH3485842.1 hypothetical protein [Myxococcales bacterium]
MVFDPPEIPSGLSETSVIIEVDDPRPELGLEVITELSTISGGITDPFARMTTFACAFDVSGPVEVCATASYVVGDAGVPDGGQPEGGMSEGGVSALARGGDASVGASYQYLGKPHIRLSSPIECSEKRCATVICPEDKNACPEVSSLTVEPMVVPDGGTATITVVAEDPDDNPQALVTTLSAAHGTITDPSAAEATFRCDPLVGGPIEICVVADDGDCDDRRCTSVRCPGDPLENTCPIIEDFTADPMTIPPDQTMTNVRVDVVDPDDFPGELRTELSTELSDGVFGNRFVTETTFTCGVAGPVELCVKATDDHPDCDSVEPTCITVQCPSTIPFNVAVDLFVLNFVRSTIAPGENDVFDVCGLPPFAQCRQDADCPGSTCNEPCPGERCARVETRARDVDNLPLPVTLTLRAPWGRFEDDETLQCEDGTPLCPGPYFQNAVYICDRPGDVEICVDATDGASRDIQCGEVTCPADTPAP